MSDANDTAARHLLLAGRVQGVGFRPFVYRLARESGLRGWVRNRNGQVEIRVEGAAARLAYFTRALIERAPPLARPELVEERATPAEGHQGFRILESRAGGEPRIHVPPDYFACPECVAEMRAPGDRRFRYPFINCTQCGPRYTLIAALPYDRPNTSMAGFPLCPACTAEYTEPGDRRFHAEPVACPTCGPRVRFRAGATTSDGEAALTDSVAALRAGAIVAVKGIGGYHLLCDAADPQAVARLRARKPRPDKPLAVMFPQLGGDGLAALRAHLAPRPREAALLAGPGRPIVLCAKGPGYALAPGIAPGLDEVGAMLPYSPLHHLLLEAFGAPLVATSGNVGGEPVLTDNDAAAERLARIADAFLHHDRPILRPADDPVYRTIAGRPRPLRLGRGVAPLELELPFTLPQPVLATGGHMKNCLALAWDDRVVVSPHIGDLDTARGVRVFEQVATDLQHLYGVRAARIACDAHPGYAGTRWAEAQGLPLERIHHHRAHAAALHAEHRGNGDWLVFTWDGVGYGEDGTLWGGETLLGAGGEWRRVASLRPFRLPGGEKAGREPWRSALALCWESGVPWPAAPGATAPLHQAWERGLNAPRSSAAGRLFDAAAALLGLVQRASFEGQGPMYLEAAADPAAAPIALPLAERNGILRIDWAPLLPLLLATDTPVARRAGLFHRTLAAAIAAVAVRLRAQGSSFAAVGLSGGVFQNRLLTESAVAALEAAGFAVRLARQVPCNDAGIAFGQIAALAQTIGRR